MEIQLQKAKKVLKNFEESNFNAKEALEKSGYSKNVASKKSKQIINTAIRKVAKEDIQQLVSSSNPMGTLLQRVGLTREDVLTEYLKIVFQDKDLTNKLKALVPLLKPEGIAWDEEHANTAPTLNLTVKQNVEPVRPIADAVLTSVKDVGEQSVDHNVGQMSNETVNTDLQSDNTAQQSHTLDDVVKDTLYDVTDDEKYGEIKTGGGVDLSSPAEKEGASSTSKISEIGTIDKPQ